MPRLEERRRDVRTGPDLIPDNSHLSEQHPKEHENEKVKAKEKSKAAAKVLEHMGSGLQRLLSGNNWAYSKEDKGGHVFKVKSSGAKTPISPKNPKSPRAPKLKPVEPETRAASEASRVYTMKQALEAVEVIKEKEDVGKLREAVGFLREVTEEGAEEDIRKLLNAYAVRPLLELLEHEDPAVVEDTVMCFRNILVQHPKLRTVIMSEGILLPFIRLLKKTQMDSIKSDVISILPHLTRGKSDAVTLRSSGAVSTLIEMLQLAASRNASFSRQDFIPSPGGSFGIPGFPSFASSSSDCDSPRSSLASPHMPNSSIRSGSWEREARDAESKPSMEQDMSEAVGRALSEDLVLQKRNSKNGKDSNPPFSPSKASYSKGGRRSERLEAVPEGDLELQLNLEQECWHLLNPASMEPAQEEMEEVQHVQIHRVTMTRKPALTLQVDDDDDAPHAAGSPHVLLSRNNSHLDASLPHDTPSISLPHMAQPLHEDVCHALAQLARFEVVCSTILEKGGLRCLVWLANSTEGEALQEPISTILQHIAKVQKGAQALCFEDGGGGLLLLAKYASECEEVVRRKAIEGLEACACASPEGAQLVKNLNVLHSVHNKGLW